VRYCGREFTASEIEAIRALIASDPEAHRARLSQRVCQTLNWRSPDGLRLKEMSCRVAMLRMQDDRLITLPPPRRRNGNGQAYHRRTPQAEPDALPITCSVNALVNLGLEPVIDRAQSHLWNEYVDRYHYLGYQPLRGDQLRYIARADGRILALLGFGAAVWKTAPRDRFIGWSVAQRRHRLHLVVNNTRFLILPWVHCKNLASRLLGMATRRLVHDWQQRYGYGPVMAETFVQVPRFRGTCYQAANWKYLGDTQGRGRLEPEHKTMLPKKAIWIYPLVQDFRRHLCI
jgi:uncharacterized protein DUF4338